MDMFPSVRFIPESNFAAQVNALIHESFDYVMFCVDDVLFYNRASILDGLHVLDSDPSVFGFFLKLSPGISFCHTANAEMRTPQKFLSTTSPEILKWEMNEKLVSHDWNYPFDFCGTIYRKPDVVKMLSCIENLVGKDGYSHPNKFEASGNRASVLNCFANSTFGICPSKPTLSVITINRVQDVYENPVYAETSKNVADLDELLWSSRELDEEYYQKRQYKSVHIGDFELKKI